MNNNGKKEKVLSRAKQILGNYSSRLEQELQKVVNKDFGPDIKYIDFVVHPGSGYSITLSVVDDNHREIKRDKILERMGILKEVAVARNTSQWSDECETEEGRALVESVGNEMDKMFVDWLARNWKKAGGDSVKYPTFIRFHDDIRSFDISKMGWISDEEK